VHVRKRRYAIIFTTATLRNFQTDPVGVNIQDNSKAIETTIDRATKIIDLQAIVYLDKMAIKHSCDAMLAGNIRMPAIIRAGARDSWQFDREINAIKKVLIGLRPDKKNLMHGIRAGDSFTSASDLDRTIPPHPNIDELGICDRILKFRAKLHELIRWKHGLFGQGID